MLHVTLFITTSADLPAGRRWQHLSSSKGPFLETTCSPVDPQTTGYYYTFHTCSVGNMTGPMEVKLITVHHNIVSACYKILYEVEAV